MSNNRPLWAPHPGPQTAALRRAEKELLYGGARGGGKTSAGIAWLLQPAVDRGPDGNLKYPLYRAIVFRRHSDDLRDWTDRALQIYEKFGARKAGRPPEFRFPGGPIIYTNHLRDENVWGKYVGNEYHRMLIEELTLIPSEVLYKRLLGSCRRGLPGLPPQVFLTANPGGVGHGWVRNRFTRVKDADGRMIPEATPFYAEMVDGREVLRRFPAPEGADISQSRIFVPARIFDNPTLMQDDPGYLAYLQSLPPQLMKAWLHGDWDALAGSFFPELRPNGPLSGEPDWANHVVPHGAIRLEPWWYRWLSLDWGYKHPSVLLGFCQNPNGRVHVYRETLMKETGATVTGVKIAETYVRELEAQPDHTLVIYADPSIMHKEGDQRTIAQQIKDGIDQALGKGTAWLMGDPEDAGREKSSKPTIVIRSANNDRIAGWQYCREMFRWMPLFPGRAQEEILPKVWIHDTCPQLADSLSLMVHNEPPANPDDAEKMDGDDPADAFRYGLMALRGQQNETPLSVILQQRLEKLNLAYGGAPDPTIAFMVAQKVEAEYRRDHGQPKPVTFARISSRRLHRAA